MATIMMWIGIIGVIISLIVTFIPIILTYIMLQKSKKNVKAKWITIINSNMVEIGFICFGIFTLLALGGAFCDSELGRIILDK